MADLTLPLTGLQSTPNVGTVKAAPRLTLANAAATGGVGVLGAPVGADVRLAWPRAQLVAAGTAGFMGDVALTLPDAVLSVVMQGRDGALVDVRLDAPAPTVAAGGITGYVGAVSLSMPAPTLRILPPNSAALTLPGFSLQASGQLGVQGDVRLELPRLVPSIAGTLLAQGQAALTLPVLRLAVAGSTGAVARLTLTLKALSLAVSGHRGIIGQVVLRLPVVQLSASGYQPAIGVAQLVLPALQLQATARTAAVAAGSAQTLVLQTERQALTTYSHYPFNSFAAFAGLYLGASDDGLFALTGADDAGVPIQAVARLGVTDFNTSHLKRVNKVYVGYRAEGDLVLRVITDELYTRDYRVRAQHGGGIRGNHTVLGKGLEARYWQFELRNQNGADFAVDTIEVQPQPLRRRIGGTDA